MHLYPAILLIIAAALLSNLLFLALPPLNVKKYGKSSDALLALISIFWTLSPSWKRVT